MQNAKQTGFRRGEELERERSLSTSSGTHEDLSTWGERCVSVSTVKTTKMASAQSSSNHSQGALIQSDRMSSATVFDDFGEARKQPDIVMGHPSPIASPTRPLKDIKAPFPIPPPDMEDIE